MKIFLDVIIVDNGKSFQHRFLIKEIPVQDFDPKEHWSVKFNWGELEPTYSFPITNGVWDSAVKNMVRVWMTPEYTMEEAEILKKEGKIHNLTDLVDKIEITHE